jgi:hypothetical protein
MSRSEPHTLHSYLIVIVTSRQNNPRSFYGDLTVVRSWIQYLSAHRRQESFLWAVSFGNTFFALVVF